MQRIKFIYALFVAFALLTMFACGKNEPSDEVKALRKYQMELAKNEAKAKKMVYDLKNVKTEIMNEEEIKFSFIRDENGNEGHMYVTNTLMNAGKKSVTDIKYKNKESYNFYYSAKQDDGKPFVDVSFMSEEKGQTGWVEFKQKNKEYEVTFDLKNKEYSVRGHFIAPLVKEK